MTAPTYATSHGFTPSASPFGGGKHCVVMLARYVCPHSREEHDPTKPPEDVDAFGYHRKTLTPTEQDPS